MPTFQVQKDVSCDFSMAIEYAEAYFRRGEDDQHQRTLTLPLRLGPLTLQLRRRVCFQIDTVRDTADAARRHDALRVSLHPLDGLPFSGFCGVFTVRPFAPGSRLFFECGYTPALGFVGRVLDAIVCRFIAHRAARALLDDVATTLEADQAKFVRDCPPLVELESNLQFP